MCKPKRLHPISILVNVGAKIKKLFIPLIVVIFFGNKGNDKALVSLFSSIVVIFFTFITSWISWLRYTYYVEGGEIRIEHGVFFRKKRFIPIDRIQSLDISEGVLQRMFGLVRLQIETAGGNLSDGPEVVLSAISRKEAEALQAGVTSFKNLEQEEVNVPNSSPIYQISTAQLLLLSLTSGGVGVVISAILAFFSQIDEMISVKKIFGGLKFHSASNLFFIGMIVFVVLFIVWLIALSRTMMKYAHYTVRKSGEELVISQGLLERRQITIPINRIQAIRLSESMVRQMTGYASVFVESAGGTSIHSEGSSIGLFPMIKINQIHSILKPFLKDYKIMFDLKPIPKRAMLLYILRTWYIVVPIVIASILFFKLWGSLSLILLLGVTIWAILKYRDAGWKIEDQQLSIRYRSFIRHTFFIEKNKIQAIKIQESYFQRKRKLATIKAFIKSGKGTEWGSVRDIDRKGMIEIFEWYSKKRGV